MPTEPNRSDRIDPESRRQQQLTLKRKAEKTQEAGDGARGNRQMETAKRNERHRYEGANQELANPSALDWVEAALVVVVGGAVYFIDLSIFAASADYFSKLAFPASEAARNFMRMLVPALVLVVDVGIGIGFWRARRALLRDPRTRPMYRRWAFAACTFVLLMPIFASASALAAVLAARQLAIQQLLTAQGVATALLALIAHGGILLGAERIEKALAFFRYRREHARLTNAEVVFRDAAELNESDCWKGFQDYYGDLVAFNQEFGQNLKPGPFDKFTTDLINQRIGWEVVESFAADSVPA
ncbi:MAG: hypothetical protein WC815_20160 [Vicinamibacterales bacterium]|jgi:hypothetical protein